MNRNLKKIVAGILSTTMLLTSTIVAPISTASAESTIDYGEALELSLYFFDAQQCGSDVDDNCINWRGDCHTYDSTASLDNAKGLGSTEKAFIKEQNGGSNTVDVSGGYHDAGDHLKFSMTMGYSATSLAWSYYENPEAFTETGSKEHLFDILKEMCDYFMKVTYLDSNDDVVTFCYMVGGDQDHAEWSSPEVQTMDRPTYWATKSNNSTDAACQMASALAASSMALREVDPDYADECLKYANALQEFGSTYVNANYDGVGSYYSSGSQKDDIAWGDVWCHLANGTIDSYTPVSVNNGVYMGSEYDYWVYSWDKVWGGYAALLYSLGYNNFGNELVFNMNQLVSNTSQAYYPVGGGWGASRYNCAWQMYALWYSKYSNTTQYAEYAKGQMNYLLGDNSANRSYLLGYGDTFPQHIHHRAANPDKSSAKYVLYGGLVGGPTDANGSYDDNTDSYSCTEPALDYNGSFILAISGLYATYGGDGTLADDVVSNASEIDETHSFGTWFGGGDIPTETTPEETTVTTEETTEETTVTTPEETTTVTTPNDTSVTTEETTTSTTEIQPGILPGDVNDDGQVKSNDLLLLKKYNLGLVSESEINVTNADVNQDGQIKANDLLLLKKKLLGLVD